MRTAHHLGDPGAQSAVDEVLLRGHDRAGLLRRSPDRVLIQRLHRRHVEDAHRDPIAPQLLVRDDRGADHEAVGDDRRVGPLTNDGGAPELEVLRHAIVDHRRLRAAGPDVYWPFVTISSLDGGARLILVGRHAHDEPRQAARERYVLDGLLARAVLARRNPAVAPNHLHVQLRVRHRHAELVEPLQDHEAGKARDERHLPAAREAAGHPDHVRLLDPDVEEAVGELFAEVRALRALCQVRVQHDDVVVLRPQLPKRLAVRVARRLAEPKSFVQLLHRPASRSSAASRSIECSARVSTSSSSPSARASSSSVGATPWYAFSPSMKLTPFPFTVCAIRHAGPGCDVAHSSPSSTAPRSWPSISRTCHFMARHLSASGFKSRMSATAPSSWYLL